VLRVEEGEGEENCVYSSKRTRKWERDGLTAQAHGEDKENTLKLDKIIYSRQYVSTAMSYCFKCFTLST